MFPFSSEALPINHVESLVAEYLFIVIIQMYNLLKKLKSIQSYLVFCHIVDSDIVIVCLLLFVFSL